MSEGIGGVAAAADGSADEAPVANGQADGPASEPDPDEGMRVVVFASQKGGAGKTTLCGHLAVQADLVGAGPVAVVDTDPQGSLAQWWNAREKATPLFVQTHVRDLAGDLDDLQDGGVRLVFIDTPAAVTKTIGDIVDHATLVIVPARPSPHDLRAVGATVDIVEERGKPLIFALNAATRGTRLTDDSAVALSQHGTVAPVLLHHRIDFATSMIDGRTVMEINAESKSAQEIIEIWQYVSARLGKLERRRRQQPFQGADRRLPVYVPALIRPPERPSFGRRMGITGIASDGSSSRPEAKDAKRSKVPA